VRAPGLIDAAIDEDPASGRFLDPGSGEYRPYLDGLRAVAVYLVVLFHAGASRFAGGYIGVDVFFVLSGYLVTQVLLRDIGANGSVRFVRFYARRIRRLLPAAFVTLLVTAAVYYAISSPSESAAALNGFKAAFLYATNWFFVHRSTAYFGGDISQNPVLHFWSLAVEEQFYFVWPLLLTAVFGVTRRLGRRQLSAVRIVIATGAIASVVWALWLRTANPLHAYYGTDARAYQLLCGALLALAPGLYSRVTVLRRAPRVWLPVALVCLLVIASSWVHLDAIERGVFATITTLLILAVLDGSHDGVVKRALSSDPVVYLGKISYGTYLWHWPVILVIAKLLDVNSTTTVIFACLIATSLASLSFQLLEHPVRRSPRLDVRPRVVVILGITASAISALLLVPAILNSGSSNRAVAVRGQVTGTPVPAGLDFRGASFTSLPKPPVCFARAASDCTLVHGTGKHLLLIGDSHAQMFIPTFMEIARRDNLTFSATISDSCPWQRGLYGPLGTNRCRRDKEDAYTRVIPALHPDVIVAINYGYDDLSTPPFPVFGSDGIRVGHFNPAFDQLLARTTRDSVKILRADGRDLVIVEPIPLSPTDPTACLRRARFLEQCRYVVSSEPSKLELRYRALAKQDAHIRSADFDQLVCPWLPVCDPVIAGHIVKVDSQHLTVEFAQYIAPDVEAYLKSERLIPR
jgi:peptidoglycan/LPS O-acetylase OafA/YrhL